MNTPHKHAEVIKAWADGKPVQSKTFQGDWQDLSSANIAFFVGTEYRVKPEITTSLSDQKLYNTYVRSWDTHTTRLITVEKYYAACRAVADAAIEQYIKETANKA